MSIEIIICTRNRPKDLEVALKSIYEQSLKPDKIVIIDSGSSSLNYTEVEKLFLPGKIEFKVVISKPGLTHQRNVGISQISSDFVLFLDDDVILDKDYIQNIHGLFLHPDNVNLAGATGRIFNANYKPSFFSWAIRKLFFLPVPGKGEVLPSGFGNGINYPEENKGFFVQSLSGCNMIYRKEVFQFNWFDENLKGYSYAEDLDFSYRISKNYQLKYCPDAVLVHNTSPVNRLNQKESSEMLLVNHHYLFKKNFHQSLSNKTAHYLSIIGVLIQKLILQKSWTGFLGAFSAVLQIVFLKNYKLPNFLERLDFNKPHKIQIAEHYARYNFIKEKCAGKQVLDCASGEGIGVDILKNSASKVVGVDIDLGAINRAKSNVKAPNVEFVHGSALELPFPDESFDVVTSVETLEHVPEKLHNQMLLEFKRVLKKGGILYITTPNKNVTSPDMISARNYFHLAEISFEKLQGTLNSYFVNVTPFGLFNPTRDPLTISDDHSAKNSASPKPLTLKKAALLMTPLFVKDIISVLLKRRHIYPVESEYVFEKINASKSGNMVFICEKG